jgi:hypothetical protein
MPALVHQERIVARAEAHEAFDAEKEANAFLDHILRMYPGIDNPTGRELLSSDVEASFDTFALALSKRVPIYSSSEPHSSLAGQTSADMLEAARQYLLPKALALTPSTPSLPLRMLKELLSRSMEAPPEDVIRDITR